MPVPAPEMLPAREESALNDDNPPRGVRRFLAILSTHNRAALVVVLLALFLALRLAYIGADPVVSLPNGVPVYELFTDPPAKSYEARNWALFGQWSLSALDNYKFWRIQAPVWVYPIAGFYRLFGVGYVQLRVFSTICAAAGLVALLALAAQRLRGWSFFFAGAFLTFNYYDIIFSRSGLIESLLTTFAVITILFTYLAQRRLAWVLAAQWALLLAYLTKMSGIHLIPVALIGGVVAYVRHVRQGCPAWLRVAVPVQAAAIIAGVSWYVSRPAYWRTLAWNYGHALFNDGGIQDVQVSKIPVGVALHRLLSGSTWGAGYMALFPIAGALALIELARLLYLVARRRGVESWEILVAGWFASSFGVLLLTPMLWVHYRLVLFPPVALLAASLIHAVFGAPWLARRAWLRHTIAGTLLFADLAVHGWWLRGLVVNRSYHMVAATRAITSKMGNEGHVFAGMWAAPLLFGTKQKWFYVKELFNSTPEILAGIGLTHVIDLNRGDLANAMIWRSHPAAQRSRQKLLQLRLRGAAVTLYKYGVPPSKATIKR